MISASHNPVPDNGIKFFTSDGFKLPDETEAEIEALVTATLRGSGDIPRPVGEGVGASLGIHEGHRRLCQHANPNR